MATAVDVDLRIDLQTMDETGLPRTFLDQAPDPSRIMPGRHIVAGSGAAVAVVVVVDITDEGIVHVQPLKGSVASNAHLLGADPASRRLPDLLADPVEAAGTDRNETAPSSAETPGTTGGRALDGTGRNEVRRLITRRSVAHPLFVALDLAQDRARGVRSSMSGVQRRSDVSSEGATLDGKTSPSTASSSKSSTPTNSTTT